MEYNRIVAVTGMPGLYEVLSSKADGAIVRSLDDQSTKFVASRVHNLSHLDSIEIYTVRENVSLADIFNAMKDSKEKMPDVKDNNALKTYFEKVYPDMDFERVYTSDMKKMVKWFEVLETHEVDFNVKAEEEEEEVVAEEETVEAKAPSKETKAAAKKSKAKTEEDDDEPKAKTKAAATKKSSATTKAKSKPAAKAAGSDEKTSKAKKK